jgi:hypothetical protein
MRDPAKAQEYREEARRLTSLPREDQREVIALYRKIADNPKVPKQEREEGHRRANALERFLRLTKGKKRK